MLIEGVLSLVIIERLLKYKMSSETEPHSWTHNTMTILTLHEALLL